MNRYKEPGLVSVKYRESFVMKSRGGQWRNSVRMSTVPL